MNIFLRYLRTLTRRSTIADSDILHLYSPVTGKDHFVQVSDLIKGGGYPDWEAGYNSGAGYNDGDRVTYAFRLWESLVNGNLVVPSEGANWTEVSPDEENGTLSLITVNTAGGTLTLDLQNKQQACFKGSATITGPKTWAFANAGNALLIPFFRFTLSGAHAQTMPGTVKMYSYDGRWITKPIWTPDEGGEYHARAHNDGTGWVVEIFGPVTT